MSCNIVSSVVSVVTQTTFQHVCLRVQFQNIHTEEIIQCIHARNCNFAPFYTSIPHYCSSIMFLLILTIVFIAFSLLEGQVLVLCGDRVG